MRNTIDKSWDSILEDQWQKDYFIKLQSFLILEEKKHIIYPKKEKIFNAFNLCSFQKIKIVILGQDPYHGEDQAHGLSFSIKKGVNLPPSLKNIFKELTSDLKIRIMENGNLSKWAEQGVLLLNSILTVRKGMGGSHKKKGWEIFTDNVIKKISKNKKGIIFILWGKYAEAKKDLIDTKKHYILQAPHPSPLSAYKGFFGCKHFSKANKILSKNNKKIINWEI